MPCSRFRRRMISKICSTTSGDSPMDGSSSRIMRGRAIMARPVASICCSPPDSVAAFCSRRSRSRGKVSQTMSRSPLMAPRSRRR